MFYSSPHHTTPHHTTQHHTIPHHTPLHHTTHLVLSSNRARTSFAGALITPWHITHAYWELGPIPKNFLNTEYPSSLLMSFQSVLKRKEMKENNRKGEKRKAMN
jgi:hypothetical protein